MVANNIHIFVKQELHELLELQSHLLSFCIAVGKTPYPDLSEVSKACSSLKLKYNSVLHLAGKDFYQKIGVTDQCFGFKLQGLKDGIEDMLEQTEKNVHQKIQEKEIQEGFPQRRARRRI